MKFAFYGYRDWSFNIFRSLKGANGYLITTPDYDALKGINPDIVFFIGWSSIVPPRIIDTYPCICLHPSPLPKYRGGSPIQHQLLAGEKESMVSMFIMDEGIDTGDIVFQSTFSLDGSLEEIFSRIEAEGATGLNYLIEHHDNLDSLRVKQDDTKKTFFKRRKPSDSEITAEDLETKSAEYFHNLVRGLTDPYPNAFIRCKDGEKLYILKTRH